ncbi:MAG: hypothetical protein IPH88_02460 [Bacteroidales bacterium]|nr:hypothetical protein [Bacteroidales bacterium]
MRRLPLLSLVASCLLIFILLAGSNNLSAQVPPPPPNGGPNNGHGLGGNQAAGPSAPLSDGIGLLVAFGVFYAFRRSQKSEDQSNVL